jgi:hypothetical protein
LYAIAAQEVSNRVIDPGLWAKAFADTNGNEQQANALYLKMRVLELSEQRDTAQKQLQQQARLQQQQQKQQAASDLAARGAAEQSRLGESNARTARLKATTKTYAPVYDQPLILRALRNILYYASAYLVLIGIFGIIDGNGFFGWFVVGGCVSLWVSSKLVPAQAIVTCPQCHIKSRVPSKTYMNFHCRICQLEAEIQT